MKIKKILNNNAALVTDDKGNEIVYTGCGLCFQKKCGDQIDESKIEKTFVMEKPSEQFKQLVSEMPYEQIQVADEIIKYAEEILNKRLCNNIYITLTDHLGYAIERAQNGTYLRNKLLWEIKNFYKAEYSIGCHALSIIKEKLGATLPDDEAGFFALHIVNAELDGNMHHTLETSEVISDIVSIVKFTFNSELDENTLSYERFVTHLKYFLQRAEKREYYPEDNVEMFCMMKNKFPDAYKCATRIKSYMESKFPDNEITDEEMLYLVVHISRITDRKTIEKQKAIG
ncbi:BglG family transcription antiterminator LicT [Pseudobutyrivibrio xylanivorans]|uniref:PRD domain-containing protein n=1 Tax=Pseudobutyrivibrio xylanivorans TaxID=185007 RepID=A0A5P6VQ66_PSEXY|nr:PRD domain-containing protein [Pseudobutyrivibrio xylanivorans]QFJ54816.1 PRD domain-containing protein [Pseudobutyrivibrio xylanivorans]